MRKRGTDLDPKGNAPITPKHILERAAKWAEQMREQFRRSGRKGQVKKRGTG